MEFTIRQGTEEKDFSLIQALMLRFLEDQNHDGALDTHWPVSVAGVGIMKSSWTRKKLCSLPRMIKPIPRVHHCSMVNKWRYRMVKPENSRTCMSSGCPKARRGVLIEK